MNRMRMLIYRLTNNLKTALLVFLLASIAGGLAWVTLGKEIALIGSFFILLWYIMTPSLAPGMVLKYYKAKRLNYMETPELHRMLRWLSSRAGLENPPELYYIPSQMPAAFATGDKLKSGIAVSAGLLESLTREETAGVLGHEISHIRNNDMRVMWFAMTVGRATELLSVFGQILLLINLPLILLGQAGISWIGIAILVFAPTLSYGIQMTLSRVREYSADLGSAELLGTPEPLISALAKIEYRTGRLFNRIFFRKRAPKGPSWLMTHPPTPKRIERLKSYRPEKIDERIPAQRSATGRTSVPVNVIKGVPVSRLHLWRPGGDLY